MKGRLDMVKSKTYELLGTDLALTRYSGVASAVPLEVADSWGSLDVQVVPGGQGGLPKKGTVSDLVAFAVKQNKQMQVSGTDLAGKLLELNLVSHPVVEQEDIIIGENEPRQFTNLIDHLVKVCTEKQTYLYEISRGA